MATIYRKHAVAMLICAPDEISKPTFGEIIPLKMSGCYKVKIKRPMVMSTIDQKVDVRIASRSK